jgi:hypothetical protein
MTTELGYSLTLQPYIFDKYPNFNFLLNGEMHLLQVLKFSQILLKF